MTPPVIKIIPLSGGLDSIVLDVCLEVLRAKSLNALQATLQRQLVTLLETQASQLQVLASSPSPGEILQGDLQALQAQIQDQITQLQEAYSVKQPST